MTTKTKTKNTYDNDREEKPLEQTKPLEQVKTEPSPAIYPDSINRKKYSTPMDFILQQTNGNIRTAMNLV
jgi:hypothetical protein